MLRFKKPAWLGDFNDDETSWKSPEAIIIMIFLAVVFLAPYFTQ